MLKSQSPVASFLNLPFMGDRENFYQAVLQGRLKLYLLCELFILLQKCASKTYLCFTTSSVTYCEEEIQNQISKSRNPKSKRYSVFS